MRFETYIERLKEKSMSELKEILDGFYSQYIRLKYSTKDGLVKCVTCGVVKFWKDKMQNGHYMPRNKMNTRFHDQNCHPQCENCNVWRNKTEMQTKYRWYMVDRYGEKKTKEIEQLSMKTDLMSPIERFNWYIEVIPEYKEKVQKLLETKGL